MNSNFKDVKITKLKNDPDGWKYAWTYKGNTQRFLTLKVGK